MLFFCWIFFCDLGPENPVQGEGSLGCDPKKFDTPQRPTLRSDAKVATWNCSDFNPDPPTLAFLEKRKGNPPNKQGFLSLRNPEILGKEMENAQKKQGKSEKEKKRKSQKARIGGSRTLQRLEIAERQRNRNQNMWKRACPDPPILAFFVFLACFVFSGFL